MMKQNTGSLSTFFAQFNICPELEIDSLYLITINYLQLIRYRPTRDPGNENFFNF